ncbi:MAG: sporulation protein YunB [Tenericutes bacterium]|nr:sporulation protein YunB [Mycoplasmatota bacterium]
MKKIKLKKRKHSKLNFFLFVIILMIISIVFLFTYINKKITPVFLEYAEFQASKIATYVISKAIDEEVSKNLDIEDLFISSKDSSGNIKSIDFNPITINKISNLIKSNIFEYLEDLENGNIEKIKNTALFSSRINEGIVFEIPSGIVFNNVLLANIGPKVPVKLSLTGDILTNIHTKVTDYGINNAVVEVVINVEVYEQVILPFTTKRVTINTDIPIAVKLIQGEIPSYYFNNLKTS